MQTKVETRSRFASGFLHLIIIRFPLPVLSLSAYACTPSGRERGFCTRLRLPRVRAGAGGVWVQKTRLPPFPSLSGNGGVRFFGRKKFFQKVLTKRPSLCYNNQARKAYAAIAQSAERILGKDEVISSNLISSSKQPRGKDLSRGFGFDRVMKRETEQELPTGSSLMNEKSREQVAIFHRGATGASTVRIRRG